MIENHWNSSFHYQAIVMTMNVFLWHRGALLSIQCIVHSQATMHHLVGPFIHGWGQWINCLPFSWLHRDIKWMHFLYCYYLKCSCANMEEYFDYVQLVLFYNWLLISISDMSNKMLIALSFLFVVKVRCVGRTQLCSWSY